MSCVSFTWAQNKILWKSKLFFFRLSTSKPQTFISNLDLRISVSAYDWVTCSRQQLSQCETFNLHAIRSYDACTCRDWQQIFLSLKSLKWLNSFSVRFHMWGGGGGCQHQGRFRVWWHRKQTSSPGSDFTFCLISWCHCHLEEQTDRGGKMK